MGRDWVESSPAAAKVFQRADETLGFSVRDLCFEGPEDELQLTANTQPAILTTSVAILAGLAGTGIEPVVMAGHSLGEYSALVAAGSLTLEDALRLVRSRGELMQEAVPVGQGAMAAVLGLGSVAVAEVAVEASSGSEVCAVANYNSPVQTVLAGDAPAIDRAVVLAKERGARRAVILPVSAPFHSPLMAPAREGLTPMLAETEFLDPKIPIVDNVDAVEPTTGAAARDALRRQIDSPVRWVESVERMRTAHSVTRFVEVGPGAVLTGLIRRIVPDVEVISLSTPDNLEALEPASAG
jgi:[acyl-carrier-protein] S-malonyltransferase